MKSYREKINGERKVLSGLIIMRDIKTQEEVDVLLRSLRLDFPDSSITYEQSGVSGSYVIIERNGSSQQSDYV